jgi:hypothetical protein
MREPTLLPMYPYHYTYTKVETLRKPSKLCWTIRLGLQVPRP